MSDEIERLRAENDRLREALHDERNQSNNRMLKLQVEIERLRKERDALIRYPDADSHAIPGECPTCDGYEVVDEGECPVECPTCGRSEAI